MEPNTLNASEHNAICNLLQHRHLLMSFLSVSPQRDADMNSISNEERRDLHTARVVVAFVCRLAGSSKKSEGKRSFAPSKSSVPVFAKSLLL